MNFQFNTWRDLDAGPPSTPPVQSFLPFDSESRGLEKAGLLAGLGEWIFVLDEKYEKLMLFY